MFSCFHLHSSLSFSLFALGFSHLGLKNNLSGWIRLGLNLTLLLLSLLYFLRQLLDLLNKWLHSHLCIL